MVKFETTFRTTYENFTSVCIYKQKYPITLNTLSSQTHTHTQLWKTIIRVIPVKGTDTK